MKEKEIAEKIVVPFFEKMGFPRSLISDYGRVPVKFGTEVKWADTVVYTIDEDRKAIPYAVVEIKQRLDSLKETLSQAESYSIFLGAPYIVLADEAQMSFYHRVGERTIKINSLPVPDGSHLAPDRQTRFKPGMSASLIEPLHESKYSKEFLEAVDRFFDLIKKDNYFIGNCNYDIRTDTIRHYVAVKSLNCYLSEVHKNGIGTQSFLAMTWYCLMMNRPANRQKFEESVKNNNEMVWNFLSKLREFETEPEETLEALFDSKSEFHLPGAGPFAVSQFLAATYPAQCAIVEETMVKKMKDFGLIDVDVDPTKPRGYLYINDVCRQIKKDVFDKKISELKDELGFPVDDAFALAAIHNFFWEYETFGGYMRENLNEAPKDQWKKKEDEWLSDLQLATSDCKKFIEEVTELYEAMHDQGQ